MSKIKFIYYVSVSIFIASISLSCKDTTSANSATMIGQVVDTGNLVLYTDNTGEHLHAAPASPAIVVRQSADNGFGLLLANGKQAWTRNLVGLGKVSVDTKKSPLEGASHTRKHDEEKNFQWVTEDNAYGGVLLNVSNESYEESPQYIKQDGRMVGLPAEQHPFIWPEMQVQFSNNNMWAKFSDVELRSTNNKLVPAYGIVLSPFFPLIMSDDKRSISHKVITLSKNLYNQKKSSTKLDNISWNLESLLLPQDKTRSDLKSIGFYTSRKNSYVFEIKWSDDKTQYIGYTGKLKDGSYDNIPTPVIMDFKIKDTDKDGKEDWLLHIALIRPDVVTDEWLEINGAYNSASPSVKLRINNKP